VGACACAVVEPVGPAGAVGAAVFELPHAATDSAVAPTTANIPSRVIGANEPAVFTIPPIVNCGRVSRPVILGSAGILGVRCSDAVHDIWRLGVARPCGRTIEEDVDEVFGHIVGDRLVEEQDLAVQRRQHHLHH
jgi:hypothetical protein